MVNLSMHSFHVSRSLYHIIYGSAFQMTVEKFLACIRRRASLTRREVSSNPFPWSSENPADYAPREKE